MITLIKQQISTIYFALASAAVLLLAPTLTFAQTFDPDNDLQGYAESIINFINGTLVPLLFAVAFIVFIYGVYKTFIAKGDDEDEQKKGKQLIIYAIAGFVVIVSVWGIVNLLSGALGFTDQNIDSGSIPKAPTPGSF